MQMRVRSCDLIYIFSRCLVERAGGIGLVEWDGYVAQVSHLHC